MAEYMYVKSSLLLKVKTPRANTKVIDLYLLMALLSRRKLNYGKKHRTGMEAVQKT